MSCPSQAVLVAYLSGELSRDERVVVQEHVDVCEICRQSAQRLAEHALPHESPTAQTSSPAEDTVSKEERPANHTRTFHQPENSSEAGDFEVHARSSDADNSDANNASDEPQRIGKYEIIRLAGHGGFADVYLARHPQLEELVAIKVPHADAATSDFAVEAFVREAKTAAHLRHPHIVSIRDVETDKNGRPYVIMDWMEGGTLEALRKRKTLSIAEIVNIMTDVATAAASAHKLGIVHRDLKPSNILFDKLDRPHIADFGLAIHERDLRARHGEFAGTRRFMSPEQVRRQIAKIDGRCDVWALGVILYLLLTNKHPFDGNRASIEEEIISHDPTPPRQYREDIPKELEAVCLQCLRRDLGQRLGTAHELSSGLARIGQRYAGQRISRRGAIIGAAATTALATFGGLGAWWYFGNQPRLQPVELQADRAVEWKVDPGSGDIHLLRPGRLYLGLGATRDLSFELTAEFDGMDRGIGVFVGYSNRRFERIVVFQDSEIAYAIHRTSEAELNGLEKTVSTSLGNAHTFPRVIWGTTKKTITVRVENNRLTQITINDASFPKLTDGSLGLRTTPPSYQGQYGIFALGTMGTVRRFDVVPLS